MRRIVRCEHGPAFLNRRRKRDRCPDRPIKRGESVVVSRVGLVALVLEASQDRFKRFDRIPHYPLTRLPAAAATGAIRPSAGLLAEAYGRMGMRPAR